MATTLHLDPLDATFGAVVRDVEFRALDDRTWAALHEPGSSTRCSSSRASSSPVTSRTPSPLASATSSSRPHRSPTWTRTARCIQRARRRCRQVDSGQRGLAPRQHLHADPGQGRGVHRRDRPHRGSGHRFRRHARRLRDARRGDPEHGSRTCPPTIRCSTARAAPGIYPRRRTTRGGYDRYGYHDLEASLRPLVKVHPVTGRPNLLIGRHAHAIPGMDPAESEQLIDSLNEGSCQEHNIYHHQWERGRRRRVGQPPIDAPGDAVRPVPTAPHVAHPHRRGTHQRTRHQLLIPAGGESSTSGKAPDWERKTTL